MEWNDEGLEAAIRHITEIPEGDIMLSDVWEKKKMFISGDIVINDLSAICELTNISELYFYKIKVSDYSPLSKLPNLKSLACEYSFASDEAMLSVLSINQLTLLRFAADINTSKQLKMLQFGKLENLENLSVKLDEICLENIKGLNKAKTLSIRTHGYGYLSKDFPKFCDIFSKMSALEGLSLFQGVFDISPIEKLTNITSLNISEMKFMDVSCLSNLTNLESLTLKGDKITDITPLSSLTNLKRLNLCQNKITNVKPLAGLTNLEMLVLQYNQIIDVSPLLSLTKLEHLDVSDNNISDESVFSQFPDSVEIKH